MKKTFIISHESDIDGLGCIVLGDLAFNEFFYLLQPNVEKLEETFENLIKEGKLSKYENIYVTDLALYDPALTQVAESDLKDKVLVLDHHKRALEDNMDRFSFTNIVEELNGRKTCGTELFLEHLSKNELIKLTNAIKEFVELTRLEDTWEWKKAGEVGEKAHDLAILFNVLGVEEYINTMTKKLQDNEGSFEFSEEELELIKAKKEEYEKLLRSIISESEYFNDEFDNKYGIVYADYEYRNELAEQIRKDGNPENIKYYIMVAIEKGAFGQKSYRSIEDGFDVNKIAMIHGGGGHPGAASVNITEEQKAKALTLDKKEGLKYLAESKFTDN